MKLYSWFRIAMALIFAAALVLTLRPTTSALADDGRINKGTWANSFGSVAVYCLNSRFTVGNYSPGGRIRVLNQAGQIVLDLTDIVITPKRDESDKTGKTLLIGSSQLYKLYSEAKGYFSLYSVPDKEGKTFIGRWYGCDPVGILVAAAPITCNVLEPFDGEGLVLNGNDCSCPATQDFEGFTYDFDFSFVTKDGSSTVCLYTYFDPCQASFIPNTEVVLGLTRVGISQPVRTKLACFGCCG